LGAYDFYRGWVQAGTTPLGISPGPAAAHAGNNKKRAQIPSTHQKTSEKPPEMAAGSKTKTKKSAKSAGSARKAAPLQSTTARPHSGKRAQFEWAIEF
jgi:hypothetical protein